MKTDLKAPTAQRSINGLVYTSRKGPCTEQLVLLGRLIKLFGEDGVAAFAAGGGDMFVQMLVRLPSAVTSIGAGLVNDPDLPRDLCSWMRCNKKAPVAEGSVFDHFDAHFSGELPQLMEVLKFAVEHNFRGFTLGEGSQGGNPSSPETPTGESSDPRNHDEE